jgi:hypothetical protein
MTRKELDLLKIDQSPLNLDVENQLVTWDTLKSKNKDDFFIKIGRARYFNFTEAQTILNNLEKHIQWV